MSFNKRDFTILVAAVSTVVVLNGAVAQRPGDVSPSGSDSVVVMDARGKRIVDVLIPKLQKDLLGSINLPIQIKIDSELLVHASASDLDKIEQALQTLVQTFAVIAKDEPQRQNIGETIKIIRFGKGIGMPLHGLSDTLQLYKGTLLLWPDSTNGWAWVSCPANFEGNEFTKALQKRIEESLKDAANDKKSLAQLAKDRGISDEKLESMIKDYVGRPKSMAEGGGTYTRADAESIVRAALISFYQ